MRGELKVGRKKKYDKVGRPPKHKPVRIVELGETYKSYEAVASRIGGNRGDVMLCLLGDRKSCRGFTFEYVNDNEESSE